MGNVIYKAYNYPIFQNVLYDTIEEAMACKTGDIELVQDEETGLIYNKLFKAEDMKYNENYSFDPSFSPRFIELLSEIRGIIKKHIGSKNLLEIGCGKGSFVENAISNGFEITGMDPAYEGDNPNIKKKYYNSDTNKVFDGLILRHVLEHIENPYNFLCELKKNNENQGLIYIEVPCFDWINNNAAFTDIYYEHVNYFRKTDFENMFESIIDTGTLFNGQYLYIVAELSSLKKPIKKGTFTLNTKFSEKLLYYKNLILSSKEKIVLWGCGPRAQIFSYLLKNLNVTIDYFVDINPAREGKYLALVAHYKNLDTGVILPDTLLKEVKNDMAIIFVMNGNYLDEIKDMSYHKYTYIVL